MEEAPQKPTRLHGSKMNTVALNVNESIGEALRHWSAKFVARRLNASPRTVEAWRDGRAAPQAKHLVAMLQDDELCARLLEAAGRGDLARSAETIAHLKAALASEGK